MRSFIVICLVGLIGLALGRPESYSDRFDSINLDEILGNRRLLLPYIKCILDEGKCSSEGKELKEHLKDALETDCLKCTEKQKSGSKRVFGHLINIEPEFWTQLKAKYDPESKYTKKYEEELKADKA